MAWQAQLEGAILSGAASWCDTFNGGVREGALSEGGLHSEMLLVGVATLSNTLEARSTPRWDTLREGGSNSALLPGRRGVLQGAIL